MRLDRTEERTGKFAGNKTQWGRKEKHDGAVQKHEGQLYKLLGGTSAEGSEDNGREAIWKKTKLRAFKEISQECSRKR